MIRGAAAGCATCCCCTFFFAAFLLCVSSKQGGAAYTPRHVLLLQLELELVMVLILLMVSMCSPPVVQQLQLGFFTACRFSFAIFFIVYTSFVGCKLCVARRRTIGAKTNSLVVQQSCKAGALLANCARCVCPCPAHACDKDNTASCVDCFVLCTSEIDIVSHGHLQPLHEWQSTREKRSEVKRSSGEKASRRSEALQR